MLAQRFGERLAYLRRIRNLTQAELAAMVGVTTQHLGLVERGRSGPSLKLIQSLARALDSAPASLFLFSESGAESAQQLTCEIPEDFRRYRNRLGTWQFTMDSGHFTLSRSLRQILGGMPQRIVDLETFMGAMLQDDRPGFLEAWNLFLERQDSLCTAFRFLQADGEQCLALLQGEMELDDAPLPQCHGLLLDITEQRRLEMLQADNTQKVERLVDERTASLRQAKAIAEREVKDRIVAEKKARESEALFKKLFENMHDGFIRIDDRGNIILANKAVASMLGHDSPEDMLGTDVREIYVHPEERHELLRKMKVSGPIQNHELQFRRKDGSQGWGLCNFRLLHDEDGILVNSEAVIRDITARKEAEENLRETMELLNATAATAKVGGWKYLPETHELIWTPETYRIHDVSLAHKPSLLEAMQFYHEEDKPLLQEALNKALAHGVPFDVEVRFTSAKGRKLWTRAICQPRMAAGKVTMLFGTFQDISDRKNAEAVIARSENRFRAVMLHAPLGIAMVCLEGHFLDCNHNFARMLGYSREELLGANFTRITHKRDLGTEMQYIDKVLSGKISAYTIQKRYIHKKGHDVWAHATSTIVRNENQEDSFAFAFVQQLT